MLKSLERNKTGNVESQKYMGPVTGDALRVAERKVGKLVQL